MTSRSLNLLVPAMALFTVVGCGGAAGDAQPLDQTAQALVATPRSEAPQRATLRIPSRLTPSEDVVCGP